MKKLSVIWDITKLCPWNCAICCMGASSDKNCLTDELSHDNKLNVVKQLGELKQNGIDVKCDISGGELLTNLSHLDIISALSETLGKENVGVSCSGYRIDVDIANFLSKTVHDVEMTMDVIPGRKYILRPNGYHKIAGKAADLLKAAGCEVGLQTVASKYNSSPEMAQEVFDWCCEHGVDNWSILRFFPSGRGANYPEAAMNAAECMRYVGDVQKVAENSNKSTKPAIDFHYLMPGHSKYSTVCRCVRKSIGILPNGDTVACFWALDSSTGAINPKFLLGNVKNNTLTEILDGEKAKYWSECEHHCELSA